MGGFVEGRCEPLAISTPPRPAIDSSEHLVLTRKDKMGCHVERVRFGWERGKVRQP